MGLRKKLLVVISILILLTFSLFGQDASDQVNISLSLEQDGANGELSVTYEIPEGYHQSYEIEEDYEYAVFFVESNTPGVKFARTEYPNIEGKSVGDIVEYHKSVTLKKKFTIVSSDVKEIKFDYGFQICIDTGACFRPREFSKTYAVEPVKVATTTAPVKGEKSSSSVWYFLILAFLGGLILNIMPCVLPVLSIKAMSLVNQAQHDKRGILMGSLAYTAGILLSFVILASVIVGIKSTGESVGWGFQNQSPWFNFGMLIIIWVFTLSLYGVFQIQVPGLSAATSASNKGGHAGSFFSGIFAVLLATPCTAPLLAPAIGFAFQQSALIIYVSFMLIGLGLAFPFIVLGFVPSAVKKIPKPGDWMITFEHFMGFLLFATSLYVLNNLFHLISGAAFIKLLWFLLTLTFGCWIYGKFATADKEVWHQWLWILVAIAIIFTGGYFLVDMNAPRTEGHEVPGWQTFSEELVQKYRDENKAVFIDFGAEWCLTCKTNEKTVLRTEHMKKFFEENDVECLFGDNTRKNDIIQKWLTKYDRAGVPLYLYFAPGSDEAVVLPEIITDSDVKDLFK